MNEREDRGMTAFFRKYAKRLTEKTADAVLKRSWAHRACRELYRRIGVMGRAA